MAAHLPHLVCVNHTIVADGAPRDVITPAVLEVLSETGLVGAFFWLGGAALAWRAWRFAGPAARRRARAPAMALAVTVFPLNTHLAFYSTFWGGLALLLAALYAGSLLADKPRGDAADGA